MKKIPISFVYDWKEPEKFIISFSRAKMIYGRNNRVYCYIITVIMQHFGLSHCKVCFLLAVVYFTYIAATRHACWGIKTTMRLIHVHNFLKMFVSSYIHLTFGYNYVESWNQNCPLRNISWLDKINSHVICPDALVYPQRQSSTVPFAKLTVSFIGHPTLNKCFCLLLRCFMTSKCICLYQR